MNLERVLSSSPDTNALATIRNAMENALAFNELTREVINVSLERYK